MAVPYHLFVWLAYDIVIDYIILLSSTQIHLRL